jgi:hypothetical protein
MTKKLPILSEFFANARISSFVKSILLFLPLLLFVNVSTALAQQTVTINCTNGTFNSGHIPKSGGTKTDDQIRVESGGNNANNDFRGWVRFNLSSLPANVTITSVSLRLTNNGSGASNVANNIKALNVNPVTATSAEIFSGIGAYNTATIYNSEVWPSTGTISLAFNAAGISAVQNAIGNAFNVGVVRGSTNTYIFHGHSATSAQQPALVITYTCPAINITTQPVSNTKCLADNASFSVAASGGLGTLNYQWKRNGVNISGATGSVLNISNISSNDLANYSVVISDECGQSVTSNVASLNLPSLTACASNKTPLDGSNIGAGNTTLFWDAVAGAVSYDVYFQQGNSNPEFFTNVTTTSVNSPSTVAGNTYYWKVVPKNICGSDAMNCSAISFNAIVATCDVPTIGTVADKSICSGNNISFTVQGSCKLGLMNLQWRKDGTVLSEGINSNGVSYSGVNTATLNITNATADAAGKYDVVITCDCGSQPSEISNAATLTVNPFPVLVATANPNTLCTSPGSSTLTASGATSYLWSPATGLSSTNGSSVTATLSSSQDYTVTGTKDGCSTSANISVLVNAAEVLFSENFNTCTSGQLLQNAGCGWSVLNITANNRYVVHAGTTTCNLNGSNFLGIIGTGGNPGFCSFDAGATTNIIAYKGSGFSTINKTNLKLSLSWRGSNVDPENDYLQIVYNISGTPATASSWVNIPGAVIAGSSSVQSANITLPASLEGLSNVLIGFRWINNNTSGTAPAISFDDIVITSNNAFTSTVSSPSGITSFCEGTTASSIYTSSSSNPLTASYEWQISPINAGTVSGTTSSATINWNSSFNGTATVSVRAKDACGGATAFVSTSVTVLPLPNASISANGPLTFCQGESITLTASSADQHLWSTNETTQSINVSNAGNYTVTVTSLNGCSKTSAVTTITVNPKPSAPTGSASQSFCSATNPKLNNLAVTGDNILWYDAASGGSLLSATTALVDDNTYYATQTISGCESDSRFAVQVTVTTSTTNTTTETVCDTYTWLVNGETYTSSGTFTEVTGCHTEKLVLNIIQSSSSPKEEVSACDTYTWEADGNTYTQSGTYTSVENCLTRTLELIITPSTSNSTTAAACDSYTWSENGQSYTASGTYTIVTGCHTEELVLTVTVSEDQTTTVAVCDSYSWTVNGETYTTGGTYTIVTACNTEELVLTVTNSSFNSTTASACDSYTWSENGQSYTASGTYTIVTGCHTEELVLTVTVSEDNTTTADVCDSFTWTVNGETYTTGGTYTVVTACNTEELVLTVTNSSINSTSAAACDSYTWSENDETYTASGTYTVVTGCHTEELVLTVSSSEDNSTTASACDSYTWSVNGETYTTGGTYTAQTECNTEELILTITNSTINSTSAAACDSYTWSENGQSYNTSGTYTIVTGCHTEELVLTINNSSNNSTTASACDSYTWSLNGETYTTSGTYTIVTGCHKEELVLTVTVSEDQTTTAAVCDSYTWTVNGETYTTGGTYTVITACNTEELVLTITNSSFNSTTAAACDSYTWSENDETYTASGTYTIVTGCHTEELVLTVTASEDQKTTASACDSYTWSVNGETYTVGGNYTAVTACNTEELVLTITNSSFNSTTAAACDSYTWSENGATYNASGIYTIVTGCHTEELVLSIFSSEDNSTTASACDSYTWSVNGETYTTGGTYTAQTECNTEELVLTITNSSFNSTTAAACDSYTWSENGATYTASGTYTIVSGCHTEELVLNIANQSTGEDVITACNSYTWINGITYSSNATATHTMQNEAGCDSVVILNLTITSITAPTASNSGPVCEGSAVVLSASNITGAVYSWTGPDGFESEEQNPVVTVAGVYSVTAKVNGCTSEASETTVVIAGQLMVDLSAIDATCFGSDNGSITATVNVGSGNLSYVWNTSPVQYTATASGLTAGTYTVTVTDDVAGCSATVTATITEPDALEVDHEVTDASCSSCADGAATITVTGGTAPYTYSWINQQGGNTATALAPGEYTVTVTDDNGCAETVVVEVVYNISVTEYQAGIKSVNIYPNPANAVIHYSANIDGKELMVQLVDVQGRIITTSIHTTFNGVVTSSVNTSVLNPGVYQLRFISERGVSNKKFVVTH